MLAVGVPTSLALPRGKFELLPRSRLHSLRGFSWTLHPRHHLENVPAGQGRTRVVLPGLCQLLEQQLGPAVTSTGPRPCLASLLHRPTWPLLRRLNRRTLFCSPPATPALSRPPPCTPCQALAGLSWGFIAFLCPPPPPTQNASSEGLCVSKLHPRVYLLANRSSVSEAPSPPRHLFSLHSDSNILSVPERRSGWSMTLRGLGLRASPLWTPTCQTVH